MLSDTDISIRAWEERDVPLLTDLRNDVEIQAALMSRPKGSTPETVKEWLKTKSTHPNGLLMVIAHTTDNVAMGYLQFVTIDWVSRHGKFGICLRREAWGTGAAAAAIKHFHAFLRDQHKMRKSVLEVLASNKRAIRLYEKCGYRHVGVFEQHFWTGAVWEDVALMEARLDT